MYTESLLFNSKVDQDNTIYKRAIGKYGSGTINENGKEQSFVVTAT